METYANLGFDLLLDEDGDLQLSHTGDLLVTSSGRTTLLQDVRHLLECAPGDLFTHPDFGADLSRLVGGEDDDDFVEHVTMVVEDALTYAPGVSPRVERASITVVADRDRTGRASSFVISFAPLGESWTNALNLVWNIVATEGNS